MGFSHGYGVQGHLTRHSSDNLEKALRGILRGIRTTSELSQVLAYAAGKGTVSYQEIKEIIKDDPEDVLLLADEWRLLLPVRTVKSAGWEDRLLLLKDGEIYEVPTVIRYLVKDGIRTGRWNSEKAILKLFKELGDPAWEQIPALIKAIAEEAIDHRINGNQIKKRCLQFGLSTRVDGLIAELKGVGFMSPRLGRLVEVMSVRSPIYELNPSVVI